MTSPDAARERQAVVAFMRRAAASFRAAAAAQGKKVGVRVYGYEDAADAIERGDHTKEREDGR